MISIEQIKAARALLNWDQAMLAKMAGISLPALGNLERGAVTPRLKTLEAVQKALEEAGIEFTEGSGLRHRREALKIDMLEGPQAIQRLFEDFYATLEKEGGELLVRGVSEQTFIKKARPHLAAYLEKVGRHKGIQTRLLVCEGDVYFVGHRETSIYRWVDKEVFGLVPSYIYGDKHAVLLWGSPARVVITQNPSLAETYRRQFEADWKNARRPPKDILYQWP
ncbi:MAG: helix-turn-helix domain-containing protein [Alphaproteobacteria bacterium]|nr:helix-turn-helix domain-containing protein [Alphaproteobacteria bacterium]